MFEIGEVPNVAPEVALHFADPGGIELRLKSSPENPPPQNATHSMVRAALEMQKSRGTTTCVTRAIGQAEREGFELTRKSPQIRQFPMSAAQNPAHSPESIRYWRC